MFGNIFGNASLQKAALSQFKGMAQKEGWKAVFVDFSNMEDPQFQTFSEPVTIAVPEIKQRLEYLARVFEAVMNHPAGAEILAQANK